jgi:hypothetical protein
LQLHSVTQNVVVAKVGSQAKAGRKESTSFLKKRNKKLLIIGSRLEGAIRLLLAKKSLLVLFFKKEYLPFHAGTFSLRATAASPIAANT